MQLTKKKEEYVGDGHASREIRLSAAHARATQPNSRAGSHVATFLRMLPAPELGPGRAAAPPPPPMPT